MDNFVWGDPRDVQPKGCDDTVLNRPYSRCKILEPSLVFLNRASYGRRRNNDVTSQEREVTMMLRHNLRTDAQICGKSATQASLFVRHGRGVNRVYCVRRRHTRERVPNTWKPVYVTMIDWVCAINSVAASSDKMAYALLWERWLLRNSSTDKERASHTWYLEIILVWTTSLDTSPRCFICVCVYVCVFLCVRGHDPIVRRDTIERWVK